MKYIALIVTLMICSVGFSCSSANSDTPKYADNEAEAMIKNNLDDLYRENYYAQNPQIALIDDERQKRQIETIIVASITRLRNGVWNSEYKGDGVWIVGCTIKGRGTVEGTLEYQAQIDELLSLDEASREEIIGKLSLAGQEKIRSDLAHRLSGGSHTTQWKVYESTGTIEQLP